MPSSKKAILSIDVGFRSLGWAVFESGKLVKCGVIETAPSKKKTARRSDDNAVRCSQIALGLKSVIEENNIKGVVGELPVGGAKSAKALAQMAMATGVVVAVLSILDIPVEWATPFEIKTATTGKKSATKEEVMESIKTKFDYFKFPKTKAVFEHVADAIGAYLALKSGNIIKLFGQ